MSEVRTTCPYCGVGCGVIAKLAADGSVTVKGDPDHPANFGRLCSKGSALGETLSLEGRLLSPKVNGEEATWDQALDRVAETFSAAIAEHGPDSVAFYVSGQLLTEDYYIANKLMKGFIGSANIDTNSRLCMASSVAGHKRAFGTDTVPGNYQDLELADTVVLVGSNLAWCHPVLFQRILAAKAERPEMQIVTIDPRRTATAEQSDMHLPIAPGGDVALFNGLLAEIERRGEVNSTFVNAHVDGISAALAQAEIADTTLSGLTPEQLKAFYEVWLASDKVVTVYSQGVNQSFFGTEKVNAILNCHLATGRIGKPGMGPFSVTGQPNAMGGREVGGLANMLACHLDLEDSRHRRAVKKFWNAPAIAAKPGLKAVDMFRACGEGKIKALLIMSTNPAVSMPEADAVAAAIQAVPFVAVADINAGTDTAKLADVLLPATGWGEKNGTVTNSERRISRQRAFLPAPGATLPDWMILCEIGRRMGYDGFDYDGPAEIFAEYAAMTALAVKYGRDLDLTGLAETDYEALEPVQWPVAKGEAFGRERFFGAGGFFTDSARGRMQPVTGGAARPQLAFRLNTGRIRDQWHTMTRTAKAARLSQHLAEPFLEVHPADAGDLGLKAADLALVSNAHGRAILRVVVTDRVRPGEVFAPMHWTGEFAPSGRIDALVAGRTDPISGQPDLKGSTVKVRKYQAEWYGFAIADADVSPNCGYWAKARTRAGWQVELAGDTPVEDWNAYAANLFERDGVEMVEVRDTTRGTVRLAVVEDGQVRAALFVSRDPVEVARAHLNAQLAAHAEAMPLLAGRAGADRPDPGPTVCACFEVGLNTIMQAIERQKLVTVDAVGQALQAGTNCGSCRVEIAALLEQAKRPVAAE